MKICPDEWYCPYQRYFDALWRGEGIDPGLCEGFQQEKNSKCFPMSKERKREKEDERN